MFQKTKDEINNHCNECQQNGHCSNQCVVYRIRNILLSVFDPSKVNIDDFFEPEESSQISIFDDLGD
jgi:hypothetical protein